MLSPPRPPVQLIQPKAPSKKSNRRSVKEPESDEQHVLQIEKELDQIMEVYEKEMKKLKAIKR